MAAQWFLATVETVLARVQNIDTNPASLGGETYIQGLMSEAQSDIIGMMPRTISQPLQVGEVYGHILVDSANALQVAIDASQTVPQVASNWHVFINYPKCDSPPNNKGFEATLGTDYTIVSGIPDFTVSPLALGSRVLANYYTDWSDNVGLEALRGMLEESVALILLENAGIADNPDLLSNVNTRMTNLATSKKRLQLGEMVPMGLQQLNLLKEVETNNESNTATTRRLRRTR